MWENIVRSLFKYLMKDGCVSHWRSEPPAEGQRAEWLCGGVDGGGGTGAPPVVEWIRTPQMSDSLVITQSKLENE